MWTEIVFLTFLFQSIVGGRVLRVLSKITVVIPTRNEAEGIGHTIKDIMRNLGKSTIIVVDANSTDGTSEIATHLGARVVRQSGFGKGRAVAQALQHVEEDTVWLVLIDGDYTYPASYLVDMIKILENRPNVSMVSGRQYLPWGEPKTFLEHIKRLLTRPYYLFHHVLLVAHRLLNGVCMEDPLSGQRVMRYECIRTFRPQAMGFDIEVEVNSYIVRSGYQILEVPVRLRSRLGKGKFWRSKHSMRMLMRMVLMALRREIH